MPSCLKCLHPIIVEKVICIMNYVWMMNLRIIIVTIIFCSLLLKVTCSQSCKDDKWNVQDCTQTKWPPKTILKIEFIFNKNNQVATYVVEETYQTIYKVPANDIMELSVYAIYWLTSSNISHYLQIQSRKSLIIMQTSVLTLIMYTWFSRWLIYWSMYPKDLDREPRTVCVQVSSS